MNGLHTMIVHTFECSVGSPSRQVSAPDDGGELKGKKRLHLSALT